VNGSCNGGNLTCKPGFSSCNGNVNDGCECPTSGCCNGYCENKHLACMTAPNTPCTDGTGASYYDCVPVGTITVEQAMKACTAATGKACVQTNCASVHLVVCGLDGSNDCACWEYSGSQAGHVFKNSNPNCYCPGAGAPTWN
jgi:hypothetical protein